MRSPSNSFVIKPIDLASRRLFQNPKDHSMAGAHSDYLSLSLLALQVKDSCMPFIPHTPYIFFYPFSMWDLVSEEKKNCMLGELSWDLQLKKLRLKC